MSKTPSDKPSCPACHRIDGVIQVSLLVNSGIPINASAQPLSSDTYRRLALPPAPLLRSVWTVQCICWLSLVLLIFVGGAVGVYAAPQVITSFGPSLAGDWRISTASDGAPLPEVLRGGLALTWLVGGIWLMLFLIQALRQEQTLRRAQYAVAMVGWFQVEALWQALYYCAQDDGVFLPGSQRVIPAAQAQEFLINGQRVLQGRQARLRRSG